jgi:hypothetical protein
VRSFDLLAGRIARGYTPQQIVDLWLNAYYFHVGGIPTAIPTTREEFLRAEAELGPEVFEYLFQSAIYTIGLCFLNLGPFASRALGLWANEGYMPSDDPTHPSPIVHRATPGIEDRYHSEPERLARLCRKSPFRQVAMILEYMSVDKILAVDVVRKADDVMQMVEFAGHRVREGETVDYNCIGRFSMMADDHSRVLRLGYVRKG